MEKYLYGAAVQGIQEFIFQTNELRDIIGASELVRKICTDLFEETVGNYNEENKVMAAAGNVKYIFDNEEDCKKVVKVFPKKVQKAAPGITFSQAVVKYNDETDGWSKTIDKLEERLRVQRNKPMKSVLLGSIGIMRSRTTGLPVVKIKKEEYLDAATVKKRLERAKGRLCKDAFGTEIPNGRFAFDVEDMCDKNNWLAVIHADGNGLGKIVQVIGHDKDKFKKFSIGLDEATKKAAQAAFRDTVKELEEGVIPVRPIVIGGDDFTVICRGSLAMKFVKSYLTHFETETTNMLKEIGVNENEYKKLTACAGVVFIKKNYPFYYGYGLAEALCEEAKKDAKSGLGDGKVAPSCLMFHKVQDSFVTDYADIVKRELTPAEGWSYKYGPYYLDNGEAEKKGKMTIKTLLGYPDTLSSKEGNALKSGLRKWMSCLSADGEDAAEQRKKRMGQILSEDMKKVLNSLLKELERITPVYDVLALCSIINKETNKPNNTAEQ